MKSLFKLLAIGMLAVSVSACSRAMPDAGHEKVLIAKPMFFGSGGVEPEPVRTGATWIAWTTDEVDVSMQPQQFEVVFDDLMSKDGIPLGFDSIVRLRVTDSVELISKFGPDWYKNNIEKDFMNFVRQAVRKHGMNETAIDTTAIDAIDAEVTANVQAYLDKIHIPVALVEVKVGKANPPDSIKSQRVDTAKQQQRIITEHQTKLAEDARKAAEESRAAADNAYRLAMGLSPEQFIALEQIHMQDRVCLKGGCTFINGTAVNPVVAVH